MNFDARVTLDSLEPFEVQLLGVLTRLTFDSFDSRRSFDPDWSRMQGVKSSTLMSISAWLRSMRASIFLGSGRARSGLSSRVASQILLCIARSSQTPSFTIWLSCSETCPKLIS